MARFIRKFDTLEDFRLFMDEHDEDTTIYPAVFYISEEEFLPYSHSRMSVIYMTSHASMNEINFPETQIAQ